MIFKSNKKGAVEMSLNLIIMLIIMLIITMMMRLFNPHYMEHMLKVAL